jgi:hypothetical protein
MQVFAEGVDGGYMFAQHTAGHFVMLQYGLEQQVGKEAELVATIRCQNLATQAAVADLWRNRVGEHVKSLT